jgi:predicted SnoaL-like aldol condensation-catalyzing enzyme
MAENNVETVIRYYTDLLAHGEREAAGEVLAPGYVDHGIAAYEGGTEVFLERLDEFERAFRNRLIVLEDVTADGDQVVVHWIASLRHTGVFFGLAPTGAEIETSGADVFRIEDGRIAERWNHESGPGLVDRLYLRAALSGVAEAAFWEPAVAAYH